MAKKKSDIKTIHTGKNITAALKQKSKPAPKAKKQDNLDYMETPQTTAYSQGWATSYGEPVRHALTLEFPGNYDCEVWTGSSGHDWREIPVPIDWVFGPSGVVQYSVPQKGCGIALFDKLHKPTPLVIPLNLPDYQAPKMPHRFWWDLCDEMLVHKPKRILLMCHAGRGRTGTMLTILHGIVNEHGFNNAADLLKYIRTLGCDKWVEDRSQIEYVAQVLDIADGDLESLFPTKSVQYSAYPMHSYTEPKTHYAEQHPQQYISSKMTSVTGAHLQNSFDKRQKAIELAIKHIIPANLYRAISGLKSDTITDKWFDQNSGTASLPELQASMIYIAFRDYFAEFRDDFAKTMSKQEREDFFRLVKQKVWA